MLRSHSSKLVVSSIVISLYSTGYACANDYIAPPMVTIPAGSFIMGESGGGKENSPAHPVTVDTFQLGKYMVTLAEFRKFAKDTGYTRDSTCNDYIDNEGLRGPTHIGSGHWEQHRYSYSEYQPAVCISWQDANAYATWLATKTGINYRLPTEQEWEYAAKANTTSRYFWGDDPNLTQACKYGNFADYTGEHENNQTYGLSNKGWIGHVNCDDGEAYTAIVGLYRPNPFGLHDIVGNAAHYLNSCYSDEGYQVNIEETENVEQCEFTVHRGGTWHYPAQPHSTRDRFKREGWNVGTGIGIRLAISGDKGYRDETTTAFEAKLKQAQTKRFQSRSKLLSAPDKPYLVKATDNKYQLNWQPSKDKRVTGYDIYQSNSALSHFFSGFYQKHYKKIMSVSNGVYSVTVSLPLGGGSFKIVAKAGEHSSLATSAAVADTPSTRVAIPGKLEMHKATEFSNIPLYYFPAEEDKPEGSIVFKTNKSSDKQFVAITFDVDVKKSAWYQLNYRASSFFKGEFFRVWQGDSLVGTIDYDPEIDDKTSSRHKVYLTQGAHKLQFSVQREGFDRWGIRWLAFEEIAG